MSLTFIHSESYSDRGLQSVLLFCLLLCVGDSSKPEERTSTVQGVTFDDNVTFSLLSSVHMF